MLPPKNLPPTLVARYGILLSLTCLSLFACQRTSPLTQTPTAAASGYDVRGELTNAAIGSSVYLTDDQNQRLGSAKVDAQGGFRLGAKS